MSAAKTRLPPIAVCLLLWVAAPSLALQPGPAAGVHGPGAGLHGLADPVPCRLSEQRKAALLRGIEQGRILAARPYVTEQGECRVRIKVLTEDGRVRIRTLGPRPPPRPR